MKNFLKDEADRRKLLKMMMFLPFAAGCKVNELPVRIMTDQNAGLKKIGATLVVDAIDGTEINELLIYDDRGLQIFSRSSVSKRNRTIISLGGGRIPHSVNAKWREGAGWDKNRRVWDEGVIVGDYTIMVAERIPDEIWNNIRANGGGLRLKFRLKSDGVLFG